MTYNAILIRFSLCALLLMLPLAALWAQPKAPPTKAPPPPDPAVLAAKAKFEQTKIAAEKGDALAQLELGELHYQGMGTGRDFAEALKAYQKAAAQGNVLAEANVGWMYERGLGIGIDPKLAMEWYTKAAQKGHIEAQLNLAEIYYNQKGLPKRDYTNAFYWYTIAMGLGNKEAKTFAPRMHTLLTAEEKTQTEQRAKLWLDAYKKK